MKTERGELLLHNPEVYPDPESYGARSLCQFNRQEPHEAMFDERVGGDNLAGYSRWVPLCLERARQRWGELAVKRVIEDGQFSQPTAAKP